MVPQRKRFSRLAITYPGPGRRAYILIGVLWLVLSGPRLNSAPEGVSSAVQSLYGLNSFRANLTMEYPGGQTVRGILSFQRGKFNLRLNDGRVIASNGNHLIVYSPTTGVVGKQDLDPEANKGGPGWLLRGYEYTVTGNSAMGIPRRNSSIQRIRITWDEQGQFQSLGILRKGNENWFKISLTGVRKVDSFPASIFSYKPPAGNRTVENPLNISN